MNLFLIQQNFKSFCNWYTKAAIVVIRYFMDAVFVMRRSLIFQAGLTVAGKCISNLRNRLVFKLAGGLVCIE